MRKSFTCNHPDGNTALCRRINAGGGVMVAHQCDICGRRVGNWLALERVPQWRELPEWNYEIEPRWEAAEKIYMIKYRDWRVEQDGVNAFATKPAVRVGAVFWDKYAEYLQSEEWRSKRALVFARAHGVCEGCGQTEATQAHHLTYERVGREMLFDLVAVCDSCHDDIHHQSKPA